jgi:hypothetical protein
LKSKKISRYLERGGFIESDEENSYLVATALGDKEMSEHQG